MPLNPRPLHAAERPGADQEQQGFREWSHKVGDARPEAIRYLLQDNLTGLGYLPDREDPKGES